MQDIYIERTSTDSVLLHITKLQVHDQGEYECYTPNTDSVYYGAYSDKTILTVIPDTLQARISALSIRRAAGESLSLSCDVSKRTSQHTHLSISWFLQTGGETLEIVTLTREFILQAGTAFHHRLESGHLRLDRSGLTTYLLTIFQLQHSDQGEIYCEATEWIQDPDKSWYPLLIKRTESTKVTVEQRPLAADVQESAICLGRIVKVPAGPLIRVEGRDIVIPCNVSHFDGPPEQDFDWELTQDSGSKMQVVSTLDSSFTDKSYEDRVNSGEIAVERTSASSVVLRIKHVKLTDSGKYKCLTPSTDASISGNYDAEVELRVISDSLKVAAPKSRSKTGSITEGSSFDLRCTASQDSVEGTHLSVTWEVRRGAASEKILSLNPDGGVMAGSGYSQRYQAGGVRLELLGNGVYRLVVSQALPTDEGTYVCVAGQWVKDESGAWKNILEKSTDVGEVKVTPIASSLMVSVGGGNVTLNADSTLELTCTVATANSDAIRMEVTWYVSPTPGADQGSSRLLVHMDRDSVVNGSDAVTVSRVSADATRLVFREVEKTDAGYYFCKVVGWMPQSGGTWYKAAEKTSTSVRVTVTLLEPTYSVLLSAPTTPHFSDDPTELECKVTDVQNANGTRMTVSWHYRKPTPADLPVSDDLIATMDQNWDLQAGEKYKERVGKGHIVLTKLDPAVFKLQILHTRDTDRGEYFCTVSAWAQTKDHSWVKTKDVSSRNLPVSWDQEDPSLTVVATPLKAVFSGGDTFEMACKVTGKKLKNPKYSVLINVEEPSSRKIRKIMSMSQDSVTRLEEWNEKNRLDSVVLEKSSADEFRFRMYGTQISDAGYYYCEVTAWTPDAGNTWSEATRGISNKVKIDFENTGPAFSVSLHSDRLTVYPGETVKIECVITVHGAAAGTDNISYDVKWSVSTEDKSVFLVSMDRWGVRTLTPRNGSSDCSLERIKPRTYRLSIHNTEDTDRGNYHCSVTPWIQTSDGSWQKSLEIQSEPVLLKVDFAMKDFNTQIVTNQGPLKEGDTLEIRCTVEAQNIPDRYFSVVWLRNNEEMASFGPTGVPDIGDSYRTRESNRQVKVVKKSNNDYLFIAYHVSKEDSGSYQCRVTEMEKGSGENFIGKTPKSSSEVVLDIRPLPSNLSVVVSSNTVDITEGDSLHFDCKVTGSQGHLSVTWRLSQDHDIITLNQIGVLQPGSSYQERIRSGDIRVDRVSQELFTLEISNSLASDQGTYMCVVTEWTIEANDKWKQEESKFHKVAVTITLLRSVLTAELKSRTINVKDTENITLRCKVKGPKVPLTITWTFMAKGSQTENIVAIHYDGKTTWGEKTSNFKFKTIVEKTETDSNLKITRASSTEMGKYQCVAEAWINKVQLATVSSNDLEVIVSKPVSKLSISSEPLTIKSKANANVEIECNITASTYEDSQFEVTWYASKYDKELSNKTILKTDRNNILMPEELMNSHEMKNKYQSKRCSRSSYKLSILQTDLTDSGKYYCVVEEWLQDANNIWYSLDKKSVEIEVDIASIENKLQVSKTNTTTIVHENKEFKVNCTFSNEVQSTSQFSVIWYYQNSSYTKKPLLKLKPNSMFEFLGGDKELMKRMQFYSPSVGTYSLVIQKADVGDSGFYSCQVDEWIMNSKNQLHFQSSDVSGFTNVEIHHPEKKLHVVKSDVSISLVEKQGSFKLKCSIDSISSRESTFEVTWWKRTEQGENQAIFIAQRNSTLRFLNGTKSSLLFERPTAKLYTLTVQRAEVTDSGSYYCHVKELLLSPRNQWHEIAADTSGTSTVNIKQEEHSIFSTVCASQSLFSFVFIYPFIVIVLLIMVMLYLYYKLWKAEGTHKSCKENGPSLWPEGDPLKFFNEIDAQDENPNSAGTSSAKRVVTVQTGTLYRTVDSHITIWCNVSGYQGTMEQDFQWSIYLTSAPEREIQIISTKDPNYAYALYGERVRSKEIYIERVSGDSVLLHITKLQQQDQGEYECYTPNTDAHYLGVYSAKMNLTGIRVDSHFILTGSCPARRVAG
ncbi:Prostaglandin F2 receptor negative regulator [Acipenser ruthenus]|uniref:Prostaglandin F2 receptor negative regulator n=1 Tax=Acipenser ruthenus TaxID=7906 RepID=A0A662YRC6_ACIRT|nr:Prostaglandin F2 receptor negative regulator [Acipenser ruthenus]